MRGRVGAGIVTTERTRLCGKRPKFPKQAAVALAAAFCLSTAATAQTTGPPPPSGGISDPPPVEQFRERALHQPPPLDASPGSVEAFVAWAGLSAPEEREDGRNAIMTAAADPVVSLAVAQELCDLLREALTADHTRALLELAILGELRNPAVSLVCMAEILWLPKPTQGTMDAETGDFVEVESLASLQAKAVDGLAYLRNPVADSEVLRAVATHPSRIVRAEAIDAYLWNHGDSPQARLVLQPLARLNGEEAFLDRVRREDGEDAASFDAKLDTFLRTHPELVAPIEETGGATRPKNEDPEATEMHPIDGFVFGPTCAATVPQCGGTCPEGERCTAVGDACVCRAPGQ